MAAGRIVRVRSVAGVVAANGTSAGGGTGTLTSQMAVAAAGSGSGGGTVAASASMPLAASGTAAGSGSASAGAASAALSATGVGAGSGTAALSQQFTLTATGSANGDGAAVLAVTTQLSAAGTGVGAGAAATVAIYALTSSGTGGGTGTATIGVAYQLTTAGDSNGQGAASVVVAYNLASFGDSSSVATATLKKTVNQAFWRNIKLAAKVLDNQYTSRVLGSTWSATVEAPKVKLSTATSDYIVVRITANQALDMNPPLIGLAAGMSSYPTDWAQSSWVQNSPGQLVTADGRFYRDAQILVGPTSDGNAQLYTVPGRSRVYWDLQDVPSHIVEAAGTIDVWPNTPPGTPAATLVTSSTVDGGTF